jgi:hypothetical protein
MRISSGDRSPQEIAVSSNLSKRILLAAVLLSASWLAACGNTYSREDFMKAVVGKSETEVTTQFGKPASVDEKDPQHVIWTYNRETFDLANQNRIDSKTMVIFEGPAGARHVVNVEYS